MSDELTEALENEKERIIEEMSRLEERLRLVNDLLDSDTPDEEVAHSVESDSYAGHRYTVSENVTKGTYRCSCPDWTWRNNGDEHYKCKHIKDVIRRS